MNRELTIVISAFQRYVSVRVGAECCSKGQRPVQCELALLMNLPRVGAAQQNAVGRTTYQIRTISTKNKLFSIQRDATGAMLCFGAFSQSQ